LQIFSNRLIISRLASRLITSIIHEFVVLTIR
jgi:hypothetical protein